MNRLIYILLLLLTFSCSTEKNKKTYSLAILIYQPFDPMDTRTFDNYSSTNVCTFGFELTENKIIFYKHNGNGRFSATQKIEEDSALVYKRLVEFLHSKEHNGYFNVSNFQTTKVYCGPTLIPSITSNDTISRKLIAEGITNKSMANQLLAMEYAAFIDTIPTFENLNWKKLGNNKFYSFVLEAEQFANIQTPEIKQVPAKINK